MQRFRKVRKALSSVFKEAQTYEKEGPHPDPDSNRDRLFPLGEGHQRTAQAF